jgi:uncharacterized surface protein with fasciclin (FAS1) repeats
MMAVISRWSTPSDLRIGNKANHPIAMKLSNLINWPSALLALPLLFACGGANDTATTTATPTQHAAGQSAVVDDKSVPTVVGVAVNSPDHTTLVAAVQHVKYGDVLSNAGPFTVYAPINAAFDELPKGTLDNLLKPENKATLEDILEYHVALGVMQPNKMTNGRKVGMANGQNVQFKVMDDGTVMINDAKVLGTATASNGLVVVIDKVLLPPTMN